MPHALKNGVPPIGTVHIAMIGEALRRAVADMKRAPTFGIVFSAVYVILGLIIFGVAYKTGQSYWLIFAAVGFPLVGPFAAVGLYEVSRRIEQGRPLDLYQIFGVVALQSRRQLPSISALVLFIFLFWFFIGHMIFALFLGLSTMTNISSSFAIYFTGNGLMMLAVGSAIGAIFALLLFAITAISLPMLLDREVDYVSAMIASFQTVAANPGPMLAWGLFIALLTFVAMLPLFLGLFFTLPLFGHGTWHLHRLIVEEGLREEAEDLDEAGEPA